MFSIIGIVVVFGAVIAGYLMEHGNLKVLVQPAELIIIGGAAIGTVLIANPLHILKQIVSGVTGVFGGSKFSKQRYIESLKTMYEFLNKARREGLMSLEADVEDPSKSAILSKNPAFLKETTFATTSATPCVWLLAALRRLISISFWNSIWKFTITRQRSQLLR
jgi:chemotaxis protein MotA